MDSTTHSIHQQTDRSDQREHSTALFPTSSFVFDSAEHMRATFAEEVDGNIYTRFTNPNTSELVAKVCGLEGAQAGVATSSGMAAGFASIMALLRSGDHIVSARPVFGSTHALLTNFLPRWGITSMYVDIADVDAWRAAITPATRMLLVESPSNPGLDLADLAALGALARDHGLILNVDNTFATPILQRPLSLGAHLVWHSTTKWFDGQGRTVGGIVVGDADLIKEVGAFTRNTGPSMSPFNAWIVSKSLETLQVRMDRHCSNALAVAMALEDRRTGAGDTADANGKTSANGAIKAVKYPLLPSHPQYDLARRQMSAGGGIVSLELSGGIGAAQRFMDALTLFNITANIGDTRSIVTHPATSTHARLTDEARAAVGITDGLVRLSIGLEHEDDLIRDIMNALSAR